MAIFPRVRAAEPALADPSARGGDGSRNPFAWGRHAPGAGGLLGRQRELAELGRAIRNRGRLLLVGPRRFGKTWLLEASSSDAMAEGTVVLRFDVEAYETLESLATAILTRAARARRGPPERLATVLNRSVPHLRPLVEADPSTGELSVEIRGVSSGLSPLRLFTGALDAAGQLAADWGRNMVVVLDEVQAALGDRSGDAERALASALARHPRVGFILSSSDSRLALRTSGRGRPFCGIDWRIVLGPVPETAFLERIEGTFRDAGFPVDEGACARILERADAVPYNVQRLAGAVWDLLRSGAAGARLDAATVDRAVEHIVKGDDPAYVQQWISLTTNQRKTVRAAIERDGAGLQSGDVARRFGIAPASVQVALSGLEDRQLLRRDVEEPTRYRLVDPFMAVWLETTRDR